MPQSQVPSRSSRPVSTCLPAAGHARRLAAAAALCVLLLGALLGVIRAFAAPAPVDPDPETGITDLDADGIEDVLQQCARGEVAFTALRDRATAAARLARAQAGADPSAPGDADGSPEQSSGILKSAPAGPWGRGNLRLLCLDQGPGTVLAAAGKAAQAGTCRALFSTPRFGGVTVLEVDEAGLSALLLAGPGGRLQLDRDGVPALDASRRAVGAQRVETGAWQLGNDGSFSLAILDSGCDTAHGDLGDPSDDDLDGPPPAAGDAADWYPAGAGWPLFAGYKVVGWHDVTDDVPGAVGPWDYHHHGTALASVAAGDGTVDAAHRGVAPGARLVVVKCYDYDETWHAWAGDFLAACDWVLQQRDELRIGPVLAAVNWDAESGIATAMGELAAAGLTPVAAMGNFGADGAIGWPARLSRVLTVGAVGDDGAVAAFSGRGGAVATKPDLVAPGGGLLAAAGRIECADNEPDDTYSGRWGTSLAAAHVAGALYLLDEALGEHGVVLPRDLTAVRTRQAVLRLTAAAVGQAETADGAGRSALPAGSAPRDDRGWGLLRVDAAVQALLVPLRPGVDQVDTLLAGGRQPVVARRLDLQPRVRYLVEALPGPGVDVELVVGDPRALDTDRSGAGVTHLNAGGAGTSEFTYLTAGADSWQLLAVKLLSGQGTVTLRVREAWSFAQQGASRQLPGVATGGPSAGIIINFSGPSFVVPSLVAADPVARSVNLLAGDGTTRPGWPVFVFPHVSAQGGLNLPLVWNLDGAVGDEIIVSSGYGSVYFFNGSGSYQTVNLVLNRPLTPAVGFITPAGQRRVMVVDEQGNARSWRHGPVQEASVALGHIQPQPPAVGILSPGGSESIVVAFGDGTVTALDAQLVALPGWPRSLGAAPAGPPVLVDLDRDGAHEVIVPVLSGVPSAVVFRVFAGDGTPGFADGAAVPAPNGGGWRDVSWPAVAGRPDSGELHVGLLGLVDNGQAGADAAWELGEARLDLTGQGSGRVVPGLRLRASNDLGELNLTAAHLAPPLAWNHRGGWGTDLAPLVHVAWYELIYGLGSVPGQSLAWYLDTGDADPLAVRRPVQLGGAASSVVSAVGSTLLRINSDVLLRLDTSDRKATITPVADLYASNPLWATARGDGRNTGAYPLVTAASPASLPVAAAPAVRVQPNPGPGRFSLRLDGPQAGPVAFEVFDLRGRRVGRALAPAGGVEAAWDGRGADGRPLPAGTYLVRAVGAGPEAVTRLTIVR